MSSKDYMERSVPAFQRGKRCLLNVQIGGIDRNFGENLRTNFKQLVCEHFAIPNNQRVSVIIDYTDKTALSFAFDLWGQ